MTGRAYIQVGGGGYNWDFTYLRSTYETENAFHVAIKLW